MVVILQCKGDRPVAPTESLAGNGIVVMMFFWKLFVMLQTQRRQHSRRWLLYYNVRATGSISHPPTLTNLICLSPKGANRPYGKMKYNPETHHRRSIRLPDYDYAQNGAYFVTICTKNRETLFAGIVGANGVRPNGNRLEMMRNEFGEIVADEWLKSAAIRLEITIDEFVVMPNHFHGIVLINGKGDQPVAPTEERSGPKPKSIGAFIAGFKSSVTKRINVIRQTPFVPVWQRNYYEHIIRNENDMKKIREYIQNNPCNWSDDEDNPANIKGPKRLPNTCRGG
jgi:REP element-mobilizing transposase RayT